VKSRYNACECRHLDFATFGGGLYLLIAPAPLLIYRLHPVYEYSTFSTRHTAEYCSVIGRD